MNTTKLSNAYKYLFSKTGRRIIVRVLVFELKKTYAKLRLFVFPYTYKGKYQKEFDFLKNKKLIVPIPYDFIYEYPLKDIDVFFDKANDLYYVLHNNKRLYFPKTSSQNVKLTYQSLLIEQNENSPHRYYTNDYKPGVNDIFLDVGCAEAMSSLEIVDDVKELFIFEKDEEWIKALGMTFADYKEKVHIIKSFVSDVDSSESVKLDTLFKGTTGKSFFVKLDVEGEEYKVLTGAQNLFKNNMVKCLCCTYHNLNDDEKLMNKLVSLGFKYEFSKGVLFFINNVDYRGELFRKALIRANNGSL